MSRQTSLGCAEQARYCAVPGAYLHTVLHEVADPIARVLLSGPFASERHHSYIPWVAWARYLAARRIEVLRYDYRGIGESTGCFEEMTFGHWNEDVRILADWLGNRPPDRPLVLHGLEVGAILAGQVFVAGKGDALVLWAPPASADDALRTTLRRWVTYQQMFTFGDRRKPVSDYIRELDADSVLEVDGYEWSGKLFRESRDVKLPAGLLDDSSAGAMYKKPVRIVQLDRRAAPLVKGGLVPTEDLTDLSWLFAPNFEWIAQAPSQLTKDIDGKRN